MGVKSHTNGLFSLNVGVALECAGVALPDGGGSYTEG